MGFNPRPLVASVCANQEAESKPGFIGYVGEWPQV